PLAHAVGLARRRSGDERVRAAGGGADRLDELADGTDLAGEDSHPHPTARPPGERPRVHAGDPDRARLEQVVFEGPLRPPVGVEAGVFAEHHAPGAQGAGPVLGAHSDIAHGGGGEQHDRAVGGAGAEPVLVAGHRRRDDHSPHGLAGGAELLSGEYRAIFQYEQRVGHESLDSLGADWARREAASNSAARSASLRMCTPVSTRVSPADQVNTRMLSAAANLPISPLVVPTASRRARGMNRLRAPWRSSTIPSSRTFTSTADFTPNPRVTTRSNGSPARVVET